MTSSLSAARALSRGYSSRVTTSSMVPPKSIFMLAPSLGSGSEGFRAAAQAGDAGAHEFNNAEGPDQFKEGLDLVMGARHFDGDAQGCDVQHLGPENIGDFKNLEAVAAFGFDLHQG